MVLDNEFGDVKGLVLKEVDEDTVDGDCDRDTLMPAEWRASNDDGAPVRCIERVYVKMSMSMMRRLLRTILKILKMVK